MPVLFHILFFFNSKLFFNGRVSFLVVQTVLFRYFSLILCKKINNDKSSVKFDFDFVGKSWTLFYPYVKINAQL